MTLGAGSILAGLLLALGTLPFQPTVIVGPSDGHAGGHEDRLVCLERDAQGRLVAGGWSKSRYGDVRGLVLRWAADGTPDPSFGRDGVLLLEASDGRRNHRVFALGTIADGLVVVGDRGDGQTSVGWLDALDEAGRPRPEISSRFSDSVGEQPLVGAAWFRSRPIETFRRFVLDRQGRWLVAGTSSDVRFGWRGPHRIHRGVVFRILPNGTLDRSFGERGLALVGGDAPLSARGRDEVLGAKISGDELLVAGWLEGPAANEERGFIAGLDSDGRPSRASSSTGVWLGPARSAAGGRKEVFYDLGHLHGGWVVAGFSFSETEEAISPMIRRGLEGSSQPFVLEPEAWGTERALGIALEVDEAERMFLVGYTQDQGDHARPGDRGFLAVVTATGAVTRSFVTDAGILPAVELHDLVLTDSQIVAVGSSAGRALVLRWPRP